MSDLRFLRELGGEFERVTQESRGLRGLTWRETARRSRRLAGVVALMVSVLVVVAVGAVFLSAHQAARHTAPSSRLNGPASGPVPAGFDPRSVSAISNERWWLLGQRPCSPKACLAIVRTSDGGRSFVSIPAPPVHYEQAGCPYAAVSQLKFADARNGFAYGCALYVTHDGGGHWQKLDLGGDVSQLVTGGGEAYAIVSDTHGPGTSKLMRSPIGKDDWKTLSPMGGSGGPPVGNGLAARGGDVFVLSFGSSSLLISHDRGASFSRSSLGYGLPCTIQPVTARVVWAFCASGTLSVVLRSTDGGHSFVGAGGGPKAQGEYHAAVFAAAGATKAVVGFGQLLLTANAGHSYTAVGPAVAQWESFVFTDPSHGIGLALPTNAPTGARVYVTDDGGYTFHLVPIGSAPPTGPSRPYGVSCHSSQLLLAFGQEVSEATEQETLPLVLHNLSTTGCDLRGYPRIALLDSRGTVPFRYRGQGDQMLTSRPSALVSLPPGGDAYLALNKNTCVGRDQRAATQIRVTPPEEHHPLSLRLAHYPILGYCGPRDPGHTIDITPVEPSFRALFAHH